MSPVRKMLKIKLRIGDRVIARDNPRHVGTIVAFLNSTTVRVRFDDTNFKSDFSYTELERCDA
jgi:hypothetical protein